MQSTQQNRHQTENSSSQIHTEDRDRVDSDLNDDNFTSPDQEDENYVNKMCFCKRLCHKYDKAFLWVYGVTYANGGLKFLLILSVQNLFKHYYEMAPAES